MILGLLSHDIPYEIPASQDETYDMPSGKLT
jgi:hypothetical protein